MQIPSLIWPDYIEAARDTSGREPRNLLSLHKPEWNGEMPNILAITTSIAARRGGNHVLSDEKEARLVQACFFGKVQ